MKPKPLKIKIRKELYEEDKKRIESDIWKIAWHKRVVKDLREEDLDWLKSFKGEEYFNRLLDIIEGYLDSFDADRSYDFVVLFNWAVNKFIREITQQTKKTREEAVKMIYDKLKQNYEELLVSENETQMQNKRQIPEADFERRKENRLPPD